MPGDSLPESLRRTARNVLHRRGERGVVGGGARFMVSARNQRFGHFPNPDFPAKIDEATATKHGTPEMLFPLLVTAILCFAATIGFGAEKEECARFPGTADRKRNEHTQNISTMGRSLRYTYPTKRRAEAESERAVVIDFPNHVVEC